MDEFRPRPVANEVSLVGYQIVPGMMFNRATDPSMTIWYGSVAFNSVCFSTLNDCAAIQIMVNTKEKKIIIIPCPSKDKDAILWHKPSQKQKSKKIDCGKLRTPPGKCMLTAGRCACVPAELCTHSA